MRKTHTSPWRAGEYDHVLIAREPINRIETVSRQPEDLARDAVDFRIVLSALHRLGVLLDRKHAFPSA
jgi:hypothetical protein